MMYYRPRQDFEIILRSDIVARPDIMIVDIRVLARPQRVTLHADADAFADASSATTLPLTLTSQSLAHPSFQFWVNLVSI